MGAMVASGFYLLVKSLEYESVNPQQDDTGEATVPADLLSNAEMRRIDSLVSGTSRPMSDPREHFSEGAGTNGRGFERGPEMESARHKPPG